MPATPDRDTTWRPRTRPDLVFRRVGEDWVVFDSSGQRLHVLNLTAALVWSHCTGELDPARIERAVAEAYGGSVGEVGVAGILEEFRGAGLLME